jgi:tetratricopeptide (TPR) repeat protein
LKYANNITAEEFERIERFLTNEMEEDESKAFEQELSSNEELREKSEEIKLFLLGIKEHSLEQELQHFHRDIVPATRLKKKAAIVSPWKKLAVAASILALIAVGIWWFMQDLNTYDTIYGRYYTPDPGLATVMSSSADYNFDKAMVEYKNGEYDKALKNWEDLYKANPANDTLAYFIGAAYMAKKDNNRAIENFMQVVKNKEGAFYRDACWYLGLSYLKQNNANLAVEYIQKSNHSQREAILKTITKK